MHHNIPELYKEITNDNELFPQIDDIGEKVLNGELNLIETYNVKFLNKLNIIGLKNCNYDTFMTKLFCLRY